MKLKLKNFRCYQDAEFEFKDTGFVLLNGKNGKGKSTIFNAILYALYGELKKPCSFGATSCSVELEIYGYKIKRTNKPNKLVLENGKGEIYEDDVAQGIIDNKIMNMHEFLASSYIKQKSNGSILTMTPTEQLQFIKNLAFDLDANTKIKNNIKELIKDSMEDLAKYKNNIKIYESQINELKNMKDKYTITEDPLVGKKFTLEEFNESYEKHKKKINEGKKDKKDKEEKLRNLEKLQKNQKSLMDKKLKLEFEINNYKEELEKFGDILKIEDIKPYEEEFEKLKKINSNYLLNEEILKNQQKYDLEIGKHLNSIQARLEEINNSLITYEEYEELLEKKKNYLFYEKIKDNFDEAKKEYLKFFELGEDEDIDIDFLKSVSSRNFKCPSCSSCLVYDGDCLDIGESKDYSEEEKILFRDWLKIFKECSLQEHSFSSRDVEEKIQEFLKLSSEKERLENIPIPSYILDINSHIERLKSSLLENIEFLDVVSKLEECKLFIEKFNKNQKKKKNILESLGKKEKELKEHLQNVKDYSEEIDECKEDLRLFNESYDKLCIKIESFSKIEKKLQKFKEWEDYMNKLKKWEEKFNHDSLELEKQELRYTNLLTLKSKSTEAEILALDSVIENINEHAKDYLNIMFDVDPIIVRIENFKQTKKDVKCKMNTFIQYKGSEYESVDQLSGGERQKCELAFELAVNSIMNSKLLLLDECINALDTEVNTEIIEFLSEFARENNKLIILISHECTMGIFDEVCNI